MHLLLASTVLTMDDEYYAGPFHTYCKLYRGHYLLEVKSEDMMSSVVLVTWWVVLFAF